MYTFSGYPLILDDSQVVKAQTYAPWSVLLAALNDIRKPVNDLLGVKKNKR
jgi:hypothetical protein